MSDTASPKPNNSVETKYAPPEATRLGDAAKGHGYDCNTGTGAPSLCTTGSTAQACITGLITGGNGTCETGFGAGNCSTAGNSPT